MFAYPSITGDPTSRLPSRFTAARLGWLIRLRFVALLGIAVAMLFSVWGAIEGLHMQVVGGTLLAASVYNTLLWNAHRKSSATIGDRAALAQTLADFLILTMVLWASGGLDCPFVFLYVFHIALSGILAGARYAWYAVGLALICIGWLGLSHVITGMQIGRWQPVGLWGTVSEAVALVITVLVMAYLVSHAAAELTDRERALQLARDRATLEYEILTATLHELDAGLEVLGLQGEVVFRNRLATELLGAQDKLQIPCPKGGQCDRRDLGECPLDFSASEGGAGKCRFGVQRDGVERLYELHSFPLTEEVPGDSRVMNLYLDRTETTLAERQLLLAERLASLGRITQGVAHELNTPLATIQTLSVDMADALSEMSTLVEPGTHGLVRDVAESAALIREETGRLGRITQSLLAGGDLVRARVRGPVSLSALVERAVALVFVGERDRNLVHVEASVRELTMQVDPDRLVQVLVNLLSNAADAVRELNESQGGSHVFRGDSSVVVSVEATAGGGVVVRVDDRGAGMHESMQNRLFEPFATTKPPGLGTGLGLYTSYMLVSALQGTLTLNPREGGGTRAAIELPSAALSSSGPVGAEA